MSRSGPGGLLSAFLQDSWKATRRLTLNFGLRYDYPFLPRYGTKATVGQHGGPETGDMDWDTGNFIVQQLPPLCSVRGFAPCIPGTGLPDHVIVSQNGKITHNVHTNFGPRFGFAYKVDEKTVVHGAFGIVFDDWAAVTQMAQNFEGSWPDIGQEIAGSLTNVPTSTQLTPTVTAQNPFARRAETPSSRLPLHLAVTSGTLTRISRTLTPSSGTLACSGVD
jgi:hypothetical protein